MRSKVIGIGIYYAIASRRLGHIFFEHGHCLAANILVIMSARELFARAKDIARVRDLRGRAHLSLMVRAERALI